MITEAKERGLVAKEPELIAPASLERTLEALKRFQEFKEKALGDEDYVTIQNKKRVKKSGWLKYALACSLSLEKREEREDRRDDGEIIFHYTYRAIATNGRFADAAGSASSDEREFAHEIHDIRALAQTRAMERAISNLVGGGEIGAEEISGEPSQAPPPPATKTTEQRPGPPKGSLSPTKLGKLNLPGKNPAIHVRICTGEQVQEIEELADGYKEAFGYDPLADILREAKVQAINQITYDQAEAALKWLKGL